MHHPAPLLWINEHEAMVRHWRCQILITFYEVTHITFLWFSDRPSLMLQKSLLSRSVFYDSATTMKHKSIDYYLLSIITFIGTYQAYIHVKIVISISKLLFFV